MTGFGGLLNDNELAAVLSYVRLSFGNNGAIITAEQVARVLKDRERLASTGVGDEVAIPHGRLPGLQRVVGAVAICAGGLPFDAIDGRPVKIFVAILAPDRAPGEQLRALARVSKLLRDRSMRERMLTAATPAELLALFQDDETAQP